MKYSEIIFPQGLNLHLLSEILDDDQMMKLILKNESKERKARRIILPSRKLLRKCVIYHHVKKHGGNFDEVLRELKGDFKSQNEALLNRKKIIKLYNQRCKEIERENE